MTKNRTAVLEDETNPLVLLSFVENTTVEGKTYTTTYTSNSDNTLPRTFTYSTPVDGRQTTVTLNDIGKVDTVTWPESTVVPIKPLSYEYDDFGRVENVKFGEDSTPALQRVWQFAYDAQNNVQSITNPLNETTSFEYDLDGNVEVQTLPNDDKIHLNYDGNGNLVSVTPPGMNPDTDKHALGYNGVRLLNKFVPIPLAADDPNTERYTTHYNYNLDRQLDSIVRPTGTIDYEYDYEDVSIEHPAGRLMKLTATDSTGTDVTNFTYDDGSGQLKTVYNSAISLDFGYDGSLLTSVAQTGDVAGTVTNTYTDEFWVSSEALGADATEHKVTYGHDDTGLVTSATLAGAAAFGITRDLGTGLITHTTQGDVTSDMQYNEFAELASIVACGDYLSHAHGTQPDEASAEHAIDMAAAQHTLGLSDEQLHTLQEQVDEDFQHSSVLD